MNAEMSRSRGLSGTGLLACASRRFIDVAAASAGLLLLAPVFGILALLIIWQDGRPVFFRQTRIGRNGRPFRIWKFRTMRSDVPGSAITAKGDGRVTKIGALLRRYKLDELPQLFNVIAGDMSLVGPRPEVPEYVRLEEPIWQAVLRVRPGITDPASLLYRNEEEILGTSANPDFYYRNCVLPEKLRLNLEYLQSRSAWQDLKLIALTIYHSFSPRLPPRLRASAVNQESRSRK